MKSNLALIGRNIDHSKSPYVYKEILKVDCNYDLLDFSNESEIPSLYKLLEDYKGISVTAPYKKFIFNNCDKVNTVATKSKSVNCIKLVDKKVIGTNTDYLALEKILKNIEDKKICILGNGAMASTLRNIFEDRSIDYDIYYRAKHSDLNQIDYSDHNFIINACAREFEFSAQLEKNSTFYDLNYSHSTNKNNVLKLKANYIDGFELLVEQARQALIFWNL